MRLLQSEIDVTPGVAPNMGARSEGWVGLGSAMIEIANSGDLENAFVLRVECDHAYWQPSWARFDALPPQGDANRPPAGKPDMPGPKNSTLKLHLGHGGLRQAMLSFRLPRTSESRAGVYNLRIVVETAIPGANGNERFTEFPATLIVRPFYDYVVEESPAVRKVGLLRRRRKFSVRVVNRGNDWLYAELKAPKSEALALQVPAIRLAVPPPEPGAESDRTLPLGATTKLREFKGNESKTPLPLIVTRVDAPSVPPLSEETAMGGPALLGTAVLAAETRDVAEVVSPAEFVYHPPIPGSLLGFGQALARNTKGLIIAVVAFGALITMGAVLYERALHKMNSLRINGVGRDSEGHAIIQNGGSFTVQGEWLDRAVFDIYVVGQQEPRESWSSDDKAHVKIVPAPARKRTLGDVRGRLGDSTAPIYFATITPDVRDVVIKVTARRSLPILGAFGLLPGNSLPVPIRIGSEPLAPVKRNGPYPTGPELPPGEPIKLTGSGFGPRGKVTVAGVEIKDAIWTDSSIQAEVPPQLQISGQKFNVVVTFADNQSVPVEMVVKSPDPLVPDPPEPDPFNPDPPKPDPFNPDPSKPDPRKPDPPEPDPPLPPIVRPAEGYTEALEAFGKNSQAWSPVVKATKGNTEAESLALRAYALASQGRKGDARSMLEPYTDEKALKKLTDRESAYVGAAFSRLLEAEGKLKLDDIAITFNGVCFDYTKASKDKGFAEGDAFPYLAYASFLYRHPDYGESVSALDEILKKDSTFSEPEKQAATRLK